MDPGPQGMPPSPGSETLETADIMAQADPVFRHLSFQVTKSDTDPKNVAEALAVEMQRLLEVPDELREITKGLFSPAAPDSPDTKALIEDSENRLNYD